MPKDNTNKSASGKPAAGTNRVRRNKPVYVIKPPKTQRPGIWPFNRKKDN